MFGKINLGSSRVRFALIAVLALIVLVLGTFAPILAQSDDVTSRTLKKSVQ